MQPTVFLDRDGTLIVDTHYPSDPSLVEWLPGAVEGLRALLRKGYALFVVSNQSGVGRGRISSEQFAAVDSRFRALAEEASIPLVGIAYCPHSPEDGCECRKPKLGLIESVLPSVLREQSYCVGDKLSDMELARNANLSAVLVRTGHGEKALQALPESGLEGVMVCQDLKEVGEALPER